MSRRITKIERDALRKARKNQGLTQLDLADLMGVNQSVISRIESGDIQISERLWQSVIEKYGVNLEKQSPIELLNIYQEDAEMVRLLVEEYGSQIPDTSIKAIRTYVEHIIGLSVGDRFIEGDPPVPVQRLWGSDWSWGPRELERFITPECARTLNWSHLLIHRNYPILIGGKEIDKTEIYIDGYGEEKSDFPTFFDQIDREGVYTEVDLKTSKRKPYGISTSHAMQQAIYQSAPNANQKLWYLITRKSGSDFYQLQLDDYQTPMKMCEHIVTVMGNYLSKVDSLDDVKNSLIPNPDDWFWKDEHVLKARKEVWGY